MLLDGGLGVRGPEDLDVGGDVDWFDGGEGESAAVAPGGEGGDGVEVGAAGVGVADVGGEELPEALGGGFGP